MAVCDVTGTLIGITGTPLPRALVVARRDDPGNAVPFVAGAALTVHEACVHTDDQGQFTLTLQRQARVVLRIPDLGLHVQVQIPDAASVTLEELLDANV